MTVIGSETVEEATAPGSNSLTTVESVELEVDTKDHDLEKA